MARMVLGQNLSNWGAMKKRSLASLIQNLKLKITFAKQRQNGVILKNGPDWGKRIQLDIGNLNQIRNRTEETILRGKETFLSGEETFLSGKETFLSGKETFLRGGETILRVEETFLSGEETFLSDEETFLSGEETFLRGEETFLSGEETFLGGKETFGNTEKTLERSNALCRQGNKGKIIIYIKYKRRKT
jgi:hypothetical protein